MSDDVWKVLKIQKTNDLKEIKKAYAKQAKLCHPEDDPVAFKQLHNAYQQAIIYAKSFLSGQSNYDFDKIENSNIENKKIIKHTDKEIEELELDYNSKDNLLIEDMDDLFYQNPVYFNDDEKESYFDEFIGQLIKRYPKKRMSIDDFIKIINQTNIEAYLQDDLFKSKLEIFFLSYHYRGSYGEIFKIAKIAKAKGMLNLYDGINKRLSKWYFNGIYFPIVISIIIIFCFFVYLEIRNFNLGN